MKTLSITVPDFVELDSSDLKFMLAAKLFENGSLSLGHAAQLAEVSKRTFMELLKKYDVSVFSHDAEEIKSDLSNA